LGGAIQSLGAPMFSDKISAHWYESDTDQHQGLAKASVLVFPFSSHGSMSIGIRK
jgi:hypothetical protein